MSIETLQLSAFPRFFEEVHQVRPFPWQLRLAERVFHDGWPRALDVPTGAGKTSAIDVAVFHLACQMDPASPANRRAACRILFVVDRRIVVDDVTRHAEQIAAAVEERRGPLTRLVAERLQALAESERRPLEVVRLRGGAPKEPDWVRTPTQPIVVVSTVDQVGSRLLFRGYGVSPSMRPVHAGLLGSDSLLLLDEAHLSQPFVTTAQAISDHQRASASNALPAAPLQAVTLSATQLEPSPELLTAADREHPILGPRLSATKVTRLDLLSCKSDSSEHIDGIVERTCVLAAGEGTYEPRAMAIILNRVQRARRVFEGLQKMITGADIVLLIGRSRPLARNRALADVLPRIKAKRDRTVGGVSLERPVIVVATQCVEVGADLDFDALVTEIAPLDSLRQRFGRLDRMGKCSAAARTLIIAAADQVGARSKPDPVYGTAIAATWNWLVDHASKRKAGKTKVLEIDFGVEASTAWLPTEPATLSSLVAPRADAPMMHPAFVDGWSRTSPSPTNEADVALFLHGPESTGEVQIIWRDDLERPARASWTEKVAVCPPSTWEAVPVPVWEARRWLQGLEGDPQLDDLEVSPAPEVERSGRRGYQVLRWKGTAQESKLIYATDVRPGDVLVAPAGDGGCDMWGWNPASREVVEDLGYEANREHRRVEVLRLSPRLLERDVLRDTPVDEQAQLKARAAARRLKDCLPGLLDATEAEVMVRLRELPDLPPKWRRLLDSDTARLLRAEETTSDGRAPSLESGLPLAVVLRVERLINDATTEDDEGSRRSFRAIRLSDHSQGVSSLARSFAEKCGLPPSLIDDVALAAFLHDAGKAHPAFKMWLYGGDELAATGPALAKSGRRYLPQRARRLAGLPQGARHEVASLAFAEAHPKLQESNDPALVLWLVGTHHGWGRPFFPGVDWPNGGDVFSADIGDGVVKATARPLSELTARWLALRDDVVHRYGPWGLARLEAILRLADHRRSQLEQEPEAVTGNGGRSVQGKKDSLEQDS
ncbi:MAG: type I-U CRISPR-associated helicase/endonuclease Cas3 [Deltaproteobacteria bacterium]|nr:type I-U CRISPR-associated helicase/endonuclease Cas3 [Deltaproteobacteria bacterium]